MRPPSPMAAAGAVESGRGLGSDAAAASGLSEGGEREAGQEPPSPLGGGRVKRGDAEEEEALASALAASATV